MIDNRWGWFWMELPALLLMTVIVLISPTEKNLIITPSFSTNLSYVIQDDIDETGGNLALTIKNDIGETVIVFDVEALSNNPNESYSRLPDICGDFVQHNSTSLGLFSPGTKSNGDPF